MSPSPLVAFVIGAGANIGRSVATQLKGQGYGVAWGSRNPDVERLKKEGFFPVKIDVTKHESIKAAFEAVNKGLGAPNVVVYNPITWNPPRNADDPLTTPLDNLKTDVNTGVGVFAAAQLALPGFRSSGHKEHPKAFIVTGNILPFHPPDVPLYTGLATQKVLEAHFVHLFSLSYAGEGFRFHFASMVGPDGKFPEPNVFRSSGPLHGKVYWDLITRKEPAEWDHRFLVDGKRYPDY